VVGRSLSRGNVWPKGEGDTTLVFDGGSIISFSPQHVGNFLKCKFMKGHQPSRHIFIIESFDYHIAVITVL